MELALDPQASGPLHGRIAATVRRAIANGQLMAGSRLPTAKDLARQLDVNVNTVLRAYRQLAATVAGQADRARLYRLADELLAEAARLGVTRGELAALLARRS